jgi:hypothetical protein
VSISCGMSGNGRPANGWIARSRETGRRGYGAGVAFSSIWQKTVVFIGDNLDAGTGEAGPLRGTGFITDVRSADPEKTFLYVVTAAHVVRPLATRFIRMSRPDGTVYDLDIPAGNWEFHLTEDVAVGQFGVDVEDVDRSCRPRTSSAGQRRDSTPALGTRCSSLGGWRS